MLMTVDAATAVAAHVPWPQLVAGSIITALVGIVAFGIRALIRGDLVPRKVLEDAEERADKWEASYNRSQENYKEFGGRFDAVTEALRTFDKALTSLTEHRERT